MADTQQNTSKNTKNNYKGYWRLSKEEKKKWLADRNLNKYQHIVFPILWPCLTVVWMIISIITCIKAPVVGIGLTAVVGVGLIVWFILSMIKNKTGVLISNQEKEPNKQSNKPEELPKKEDKKPDLYNGELELN